MNIGIVSNYLGRIIALDSVCMIPALFIALVNHEQTSACAFLIVVGIQLAVAVLLMLIRAKDKKMYAREGFVIVALSWILISVFGALPMTLCGAIPSYLDALFETISGFTTTGATILTDVEALPMSILYWRSFTHWLGGMGVLVLILAISPAHKEGGTSLHILRAESPGPTVGKLAPKLHLTARILYSLYIGLTVLQFVLLLLGKMPAFDALTTTFGTAGTGGFGIRNDSLASYSPYCQIVTAVFMMLFGVNFNIYFFMLMADWHSAFKNTELCVYLALIAFSTAAITVSLRLHSFFANTGEALLHSFFQVSSIITTTGFSTVDFNQWPEFTHEILIILMLVGACAGSTGGGLKVSRIIILFRSVRSETKKMLHPHSINAVTVDGKPLEKGTSEKCYAYFFVYAVILTGSVLLVSLDGFGFTTNFTGVLACLNNIGPGFEKVGPSCNFSLFSPLSKIVLMFNMLLGRLELFPIILLLRPSTWSKN